MSKEVKQFMTEVSDDDGHRYIIPVDELDHWWDYLDELSIEDEPDVPVWAIPIEGSRIIFSDWQEY